MIISLNPAVGKNPLPPTLVKLTGSDEIVIIELQGSLTTTGDAAGQLVGTFSMHPDTNKPTLLVGHHLLEGTIQTLAKPCAVIVRSKRHYSDHPQPTRRIDDGDRYSVGNRPSLLYRSSEDLGGEPYLEADMCATKQAAAFDDRMDVDLFGDKATIAMATGTGTAKERLLNAEAKPSAGDEKLESGSVKDELGIIDEPPYTFGQNPIKQVSYDIVTIVRKKIVFAKRPIPVLPRSLKGLGSDVAVAVPGAVVGGNEAED